MSSFNMILGACIAVFGVVLTIMLSPADGERPSDSQVDEPDGDADATGRAAGAGRAHAAADGVPESSAQPAASRAESQDATNHERRSRLERLERLAETGPEPFCKTVDYEEDLSRGGTPTDFEYVYRDGHPRGHVDVIFRRDGRPFDAIKRFAVLEGPGLRTILSALGDWGVSSTSRDNVRQCAHARETDRWVEVIELPNGQPLGVCRRQDGRLVFAECERGTDLSPTAGGGRLEVQQKHFLLDEWSRWTKELAELVPP